MSTKVCVASCPGSLIFSMCTEKIGERGDEANVCVFWWGGGGEGLYGLYTIIHHVETIHSVP